MRRSQAQRDHTTRRRGAAPQAQTSSQSLLRLVLSPLTGNSSAQVSRLLCNEHRVKGHPTPAATADTRIIAAGWCGARKLRVCHVGSRGHLPP
ncbi:hypothetical protein NDU88_006703 [Pleurodeles waltl]|uniref:Uncharacterized protein n=1 Tax=Pleurodeles waltl TaxID=8319 RepID=A0AAV7RPK0_PLEWA|nr:hypothetical protein NDU88_006703 [Pleurodeles waltl]